MPSLTHIRPEMDFSRLCVIAYGREMVTRSWSNPFPFYLYFQFVPPSGLISLGSLLPTLWSQLSLDLQLPLFGCTIWSLIIIKANIYWIITLIPGTLQGVLHTLFLLILEMKRQQELSIWSFLKQMKKLRQRPDGLLKDTEFTTWGLEPEKLDSRGWSSNHYPTPAI